MHYLFHKHKGFPSEEEKATQYTFMTYVQRDKDVPRSALMWFTLLKSRNGGNESSKSPRSNKLGFHRVQFDTTVSEAHQTMSCKISSCGKIRTFLTPHCHNFSWRYCPEVELAMPVWERILKLFKVLFCSSKSSSSLERLHSQIFHTISA